MSVLVPTPVVGCLGSDLDELFPYRGLLKAAASKVLDQLLEAKRRSDIGDYKGKREILRRLMRDKPQDWVIDHPHYRHPGVTHTPTKFRLHTLRRDIPTEVKSIGTQRFDSGTPGPTPGVTQHPRAITGSVAEVKEQQRKQRLAQLASKIRPQLQQQAVGKVDDSEQRYSHTAKLEVGS